jgi:hypothetical protein
MRFGRALRGEKGQEDCVRNAHTSKSMETCWKGRKSRAWQPWTQLERRGLAKQAAVSPAELTEEVLVRVWQTLTLEEARKKVRTESLANSLTKKKKKKNFEGLANFQEAAIQGEWRGSEDLGLDVQTRSQ